jgi:hypothetical protein
MPSGLEKHDFSSNFQDVSYIGEVHTGIQIHVYTYIVAPTLIFLEQIAILEKFCTSDAE